MKPIKARAKDGPFDKKDLLDFIENRLGIKLLEYQKDLIMKLPITKKELYILYGRKGNIYIGEKEKRDEN